MKRANGQKHARFAVMPPEELVAIRERLGLSQEQMAGTMETAIRNYQRWESGESRVPGPVKVLAHKLLEFDRGVMEVIRERMEKRIEDEVNRNGGSL